MTEKRWLIRTRSKQILGPASKEKILSLLEKQSLNDEDELSSGNGYWFWVKEKDLVEKYLYKSEIQGFNPVSESKSVLKPEEVKPNVQAEGAKNIESSDEDSDFVIPAQEDLEFPDIEFSDGDSDEEEMSLDQTSVITLDQLSSKSANTQEQQQTPLTNQKNEQTNEQKEEKKLESKEADKLEKNKEIKPAVKELKKTGNDRYLFLLLIFICFILFSVFYYYRTIINKPIPIIGISNAHAQSMTSLVKKKV